MRAIVSEVVADMQKGTDPKLTGGWSRGCPTKREERALIEVWVAFTEKVEAIYAADVGRLEAKLQQYADDLTKAHDKIAKMERDLRDSDKARTSIAINGHVDRLGANLPSAEATRLIAETSVA